MFRTYLAGLATGATGFGLMGAGLTAMILHPDPFVGGALMGFGACLLLLAIWIGHEIYHGRFEFEEERPPPRESGPPETWFYFDPGQGCDDQDGLTMDTAFATVGQAIAAAEAVRRPGIGVVFGCLDDRAIPIKAGVDIMVDSADGWRIIPAE